MVDANYYCDRCGKFIINKKDRINGDLYADDAIYIGDPVGEIEYNLLIKPFKKEHPCYNRRLEGIKILCTDCSLKMKRRFKMQENSYFSWLLDIIEHEKQEKSYILMLGELYDTDFGVLSTVPRDQNRAFDGLRLRDLFLDSVDLSFETGSYIFSDKKTCSILEMIIGISKRMNDELMTEVGDDKTAQYFWEICQNLGLLYYDDDKFTDSFYWNCGHDVGEICKKLCLRKYKPDGTNGGMFPMPGNTRINQKKTEIWFQMQEYINWKYGIEEFDN